MKKAKTAGKKQAETKENPMSRLTNSDLIRMNLPDLEKLYKDANVPSISDLDGKFKGYMLSITGTDKGPGILREAVRNLAKSRFFVWRGKTFKPVSNDAGEGINRLLSDKKPLTLFKFETSVKPSAFGNFDCVELNYDLPGNFGPIRLIRDELRKLNGNLFLGQAYMKIAGKHRFLCYFSVERP